MIPAFRAGACPPRKCCSPLRNEIEARDPSRLEEAVEMVARAFTHRYGNGRIDLVTAIR
jgi:hypothetical protein